MKQNLNCYRYSIFTFLFFSSNITRSREIKQSEPWGIETRMVYSTKHPVINPIGDSKINVEETDRKVYTGE